jgi:Flp pilus assembly protein TadD
MRSWILRFAGWALGLAVLAGLLVALGLVALRGRADEAPDVLIRKAQEAITAQRWDRAASLLDRLAGARVRGSTLDYLRGQLEDARGDPDAAVAALGRIPDGDRLAARAQLLVGQVERKRDRARAAEAALREAVRLDPRLAQPRRELAFLYGIQGRRAEMDAQFRSLSRLVTLDRNGVFLWSNCNEDILFNIANRPVLERFLAADPDDRWSRLALAEFLLRSHEFDECDVLLEPLAADDPEALALRARVGIQRGQGDEAARLLALGAADDPVLAGLRGQLALRRRDSREAIRQFRIALERNPDDRESVTGLSVALHTLGEEAESQAMRRRANLLRDVSALLLEEFDNLKLGAKDPTLPRRLGAACEAAGRAEVARSWYQVALGLTPNDPRVRQALDRLGVGPL